MVGSDTVNNPVNQSLTQSQGVALLTQRRVDAVDAVVGLQLLIGEN